MGAYSGDIGLGIQRWGGNPLAAGAEGGFSIPAISFLYRIRKTMKRAHKN
jgi:hypothetical protein